jgi:hypothetical protein
MDGALYYGRSVASFPSNKRHILFRIVQRFAPAAFLLVLLVTGGAYAQVEDVQPPHPTSVDHIVLRVGTATIGMTLQPLVINGSTIEITFRGGGELPTTGTHFVSLGRLPAGTYSVVVTFEFTFGGDEVQHTVTLPPFEMVVAPGSLPIPLLDSSALAVLIATLAVAAVFALGHK